MRSRIAILATLALGMVLSTGGAGLAVSGFTNPSGNAAETQYGNSTPTPEATEGGGSNDVLGEEDSGGPAPEENGGPAGSEDENESQPARQVEAGAQASGERAAPVHGLRRDPRPARRRGAAGDGSRAAASHLKRVSSRSDITRGGLYRTAAPYRPTRNDGTCADSTKCRRSGQWFVLTPSGVASTMS